MKSFYLFVLFVFSFAVLVISQDDEDANLQTTLKNLCEANRQGSFGYCCDGNSNGTTVTLQSWISCFGQMYSSPDPFVTRLDFSYEEITVIPSGAFSSLTHLASLSFAYNSIETIEGGAFKGLDQLSSLGLSDNTFTKLVSGTFDGLSNLASLNLNSLGITEIEGGAFKGLDQLSSLELHGNSLTKLVSGTFDGLSSLPFLYLNSFGIEEIEEGAFKGLDQLNDLILGANSLTKLVSGTFDGLSNLASLNLIVAGITEIEEGAFKGLGQLNNLYLGGNAFTKLVSGTFDGLSNLPFLNLNSLGITEIEGGAFKGLDQLTTLELHGNSLTKLVSGTFDGLNNLFSLSLSYNSIVYLEENIFGSNTELPYYMYINRNNLLFLPSSYSSATTATPGVMDVRGNCLDCSLYSSLTFLASCSNSYQSSSYCPRNTNLCTNIYKFQNDHCFKCNSTDDDAFCDICMPGYKHTVSGCGCVKCEEGDNCEFGEVRNPDSPCSSCSFDYDSGSKCSYCAVNYKRVEGDCVVCGDNECCPGGSSSEPLITRCTKCSDNQTECEKCVDGYRAENQCRDCAVGFLYDEGECFVCGDNECCPGGFEGVSVHNCSKCAENQTECLSCEVGTKYFYDEDRSIHTCEKCGENECCLGGNLIYTCAECLDDMSGCKTCHVRRRPENGLCVWGDYGECWPEGRDPTDGKIEHCISCREYDEGCALCEKEYRNQDGICVEKNKYKSMSIINGVNIFVVSVVMFVIGIIGMF